MRREPLAYSTFTDVMGVPAWKALPAWYLVATHLAGVTWLVVAAAEDRH